MVTNDVNDSDYVIAGMVICGPACYQEIVDEQSRLKCRELGIASYQDDLFGLPPPYFDP